MRIYKKTYFSLYIGLFIFVVIISALTLSKRELAGVIIGWIFYSLCLTILLLIIGLVTRRTKRIFRFFVSPIKTPKLAFNKRHWLIPFAYSVTGLVVLIAILGSVQSPKPNISALSYLLHNIGNAIYHSEIVSCIETNPVITSYKSYTYDRKCLENECIKRGEGKIKGNDNSESATFKSLNIPPSYESQTGSTEDCKLPTNYFGLKTTLTTIIKKGVNFNTCLNNTEDVKNPADPKYKTARDRFFLGIIVSRGRCPDGYSLVSPFFIP